MGFRIPIHFLRSISPANVSGDDFVISGFIRKASIGALGIGIATISDPTSAKNNIISKNLVCNLSMPVRTLHRVTIFFFDEPDNHACFVTRYIIFYIKNIQIAQ